MLNFVQWCEKKNYELPAMTENQTRAGHSQEYPDGYSRSQYPPAYFAPTNATSYLDLANAKKISMRKDATNTPL